VDYEIRAARRDEINDMQRTMGVGFSFDPIPAYNENFAEFVELDRTRCVFDGTTMVATSGAFSLDLTVPGGTLPTAGTTLVSVLPTHRRRGVLRAMMRAHIEDVRERNEPLAALWASESGIYSRFGYGSAAYMSSVEIERAHAAFAEPLEAAGSFRLLELDEAHTVLPQVYDQARLERPGHFARPPAWWKHRNTLDEEWNRDGASKYRYALYEEADVPRGYLQYRTKNRGGEGPIPNGEVIITELQGLDGTARAALWRFALDIDLMHTISAWNQPVDDVLPWLLADPRRMKQKLFDSLWVRLVDVPRALEGRRYSAQGRLVFEVQDRFCPWNAGTYELEAGPDGAKCRPSSAPAELRVRVQALGATFLGGHRFQQLAQAGWVEAEPDILRRADALFTWHPLPWCPEIF
jgi:predicted acetyltransferase